MKRGSPWTAASGIVAAVCPIDSDGCQRSFVHGTPIWQAPTPRHCTAVLPIQHSSVDSEAHQGLARRGRGSLAHGQRVDDLLPQRADRRVRLLRHVEYVLRQRKEHNRRKVVDESVEKWVSLQNSCVGSRGPDWSGHVICTTCAFLG